MLKKVCFFFVALTAASNAQALGDYFPLKIETQWIYAYRSTVQEYGDIVNRVKTTIDTGAVYFKVISRVTTDSATLWTVEERDSLVRTVHDYLLHTDTVFAANTSGKFILSEYPDSLHTIKSQSNIPIFNFPHTWTGWGDVTSSKLSSRFGNDSSYRISSELIVGPGPISRWDSLRFQKDRGLTYVQSYVDKGPSTRYRSDWDASLLAIVQDTVPSIVWSQPVVYPLQVGTRWEFQGQPLSPFKPPAPKEVVKDTLMENGKRYAAVLYDGATEPEYQRAANDSVFVYDAYLKEESMVFRFNALEKDTIASYPNGQTTKDIILLDTSIATIFGKQVRVYKFLIDIRQYIDDERVITVADSIGIIKVQTGFGYTSTISGAFIDGVKYGTIQTFAQRYYPLTVGNQWFYDSTSNPFSVKVVSDTLISNGQRYSVLNRRDLAYGQYVRVDSHFVYYYEPFRLREYATLKLDGKQWDTTAADDGYRRSIITAIDTVMMFGERTRLIHYRLYGPIDQSDVILSDKFGPVGAGYYGDPPAPWPDFTRTAVGCIIDGWKYGLVTSVNIEKNLPDGFELSQNYPNPFNPSTTISYAVPTRSHVVIRIFNAIGQHVATLVDETKAAGSYTAVWNASRMSSGIYYYQMRAGAFAKTNRMAIVK